MRVMHSLLREESGAEETPGRTVRNPTFRSKNAATSNGFNGELNLTIFEL